MTAADAHREPIAVIGMAGRFPGAPDVRRFWENVRDGVESVRTFDDEELRAKGVSATLLAHPDYVPASGVLDDMDEFDAGFFGFTPRDAEVMDPQHRLFLEVSWHALEDAGYAGTTPPGRVGVFGGVGPVSYLWTNVVPALEPTGLFDPVQARVRNDKDFLTTWVSYKLGLTGPSVDVQTACSTSLVAVHLACESILAGECDVALAGGAFIGLPHGVGYLHQRGGVTSPDGHCRPFDRAAQGFVMGSGGAAVVLKRLADARRDGDHVYAVVRGSAVNNDGAVKAGFTAPSVDGQATVIAEALRRAGSEPDSIGYLEAHGTGTALGDPIEIEALKVAWGTERRGFCALGSTKANIGHLDAAAGIVGLLKATLALHHRWVPPLVGFTEPNPLLELDDSPFHVPTEGRSWADGPQPRRAGVSSLGMGGTNAHVILEEAPAAEAVETAETADAPAPSPVLVPLSARSPDALDRATAMLADHLVRGPSPNLADVAWTLQAGRRPFDVRRFAVAVDTVDLVSRLRDEPSLLSRTAVAKPSAPSIAFLFPGQGAQYPDMARALYDEMGSAFRRTVDACVDLLRQACGWDLRTVLYPSLGVDAPSPGLRLDDTAVTQPALFVVEYALARQLMAWGIQPTHLGGHSIGEYVAACLAGVFSVDDAVRVVAERGRLMQACRPGSMLALRASEEEASALFSSVDDDGLTVATVNGPRTCVVSGSDEGITELADVARAKGIAAQVLETSHAFHSPSMDPIVDDFVAFVGTVTRQAPTMPVLSNVSGTWLRDDEAVDPGYWGRQLRHAVRFGDDVGELLAVEDLAVVEVGPPAVSGLVRQHPSFDAKRVMLSVLGRRDEAADARAVLLDAVGRLWATGVPVDWEAQWAGTETRPRRVPLPGYAFEHKRYWLEPAAVAAVPAAPAVPTAPAVAPAAAPSIEIDLRTDDEQGTVVEAAPAPADDVEQVMLGIWRDVFGTASIEPTDNFFDLGGDSLSAIQLVNRIAEVLGVELPMETLFDVDTVADLARVAAEQAPAR